MIFQGAEENGRMKEQVLSEQRAQLQDSELASISGGIYTGPVFMYIIQPGDSLSVLAHRFGTTVRVLTELNSITDPNRIRSGATIMIPQR